MIVIKNKISIAGILFSLLVSAGYIAAEGPAIHLPESVFDFGFVIRDVKVAHPFIIKNTGGDSLHILEVKPGCSCTQAPLEKSALAPGESTYTEIIFKTGRYNGKTVKNTRIKTATQPVQWIQIKAYVLPNARLSKTLIIRPMEVDLDRYRPDDPRLPWTVNVTARNEGETPVRMRLVAAPGDLFAVEVPDNSIPPDGSANLELKFDERIINRVLNKSFTIALDDSAATRYTVAVRKSGSW